MKSSPASPTSAPLRRNCDALTQSEFTRQYWCETWQECEWTQGASWKIMIPDGRVGDSGKVLEIDRPRKLVLSWHNQFVPELLAEGPDLIDL